MRILRAVIAGAVGLIGSLAAAPSRANVTYEYTGNHFVGSTDHVVASATFDSTVAGNYTGVVGVDHVLRWQIHSNALSYTSTSPTNQPDATGYIPLRFEFSAGTITRWDIDHNSGAGYDIYTMGNSFVVGAGASEDRAGASASNTTITGNPGSWVQRKKVVILLQGINTSLACDSSGNCTPGDAFRTPEPQTFGPLRAQLAAAGLLEGESVFWYSYHGGAIGVSGAWKANPYACLDTAQRYGTSLQTLTHMMEEIANRGNVDFYLVGHSQGGLIALQALGLALDLGAGGFASNSKLKGVFTLDSPLGGLPDTDVDFTSWLTCWNGPANRQLVELFGTNPGTVNSQGDLAQPLCQLLGKCTAAGTGTNLDLAAKAISDLGITIVTYGNSLDAVYERGVCLPISASAAGNNLASQIITVAQGGMVTGPNFYDALNCNKYVSKSVEAIIGGGLGLDRILDRLDKSTVDSVINFKNCIRDCASESHKWIRAAAHQGIVDMIVQ